MQLLDLKQVGRDLVEIVRVHPKNTSQMCSGCGKLVLKDLSVRVHRCPDCGLILDRDINTARNILWLGRSQLALTWISGSSVVREALPL